MTTRRARRWHVSILTAAVIALTSMSAMAGSAPENEPRSWLAQPSTPEKPAPVADAPRGRWRAVWVAVGALAIAGVAMYLRRSGRMTAKLPQSTRLRVLSSVRVAPKGYVVLIGVGERAMLVGATDGSIRRLAWVKPERLGIDQVGSPREGNPENHSEPSGSCEPTSDPPSAIDDTPRDDSARVSRRSSAPPSQSSGSASTSDVNPRQDRTAASTPSFGNMLRGLLGTGRPRASPTVRAHQGSHDLPTAANSPRRPVAQDGGHGEAAMTVANGQKDTLDWSPRVRTAQMAAARAAGATAGGTGPEAPRVRGEPASSKAEAEPPKELQVEEQASGLIGRAKRRRK